MHSATEYGRRAAAGRRLGSYPILRILVVSLTCRCRFLRKNVLVRTSELTDMYITDFDYATSTSTILHQSSKDLGEINSRPGRLERG
eukprot:6177055-Pleurochrysis_carterae.AAC.1